MKSEEIARAAHEMNRLFCNLHGDDSQPTWEEAPKWQRDSAINGVEFTLLNPDAGDSASHDNWMREKVDAGWKWGPVKDPEKLEHPCIVPFERLPPVQQAKDAIFRAVVLGLGATTPADTPTE